MGQKRLLVMSRGFGCEKVFGHMFDSVFQHRTGNNIFQLNFSPDDTFLFEGGTDISPRFYEQRPSSKTQRPDQLRDGMEEAIFLRGNKVGAKFIGICRGAQLLTALAGGELIQDVTGHAGPDHKISVRHLYGTPQDFKGELECNSLHHQMMFPFGLPKEDYTLEAWCETPRSKHYLIEGDADVKKALPAHFVEPEVVWYKKIRGLAIQGHPEFVEKEDSIYPFVKYCQNLTKEHIFNDIPA